MKNQRDSGSDPVLSAKQEKIEAKAFIEKEHAEKAESAYTVRILCDEYLAGHIYRHRAKKGATEITRMFDTMLGSLEKLPATAITRAMAFTPEGPDINRALLLAKADELDRKIKELPAMRDGLRHAAVCNAPNHFECPKFLHLLRVAGKNRFRQPNKLKENKS